MSLNKKLLNKSPAAGVENSFNTLIYDGNNSSQSITGLGFQPDLLWIKQRGCTNPQGWWDSTRGAGKLLVVNTTAAETGNAGDFVGSFDVDGFEVNRNYLTYTNWDTTNYGVGDTADKYVAWAWKVNGGTTTSNGDGSITSTVQVNADAGISIVEYTANATSGATIGHGLGAEPDLVIVKSTNLTTQSWNTYVKDITDSDSEFFTLNTSAAIGNTANPRFIVDSFSSTVFSVGDDNATNGINGTDEYIAYCFVSVAGYSKISSYAGTSSSHAITGLGFQPDWVLIKEIDGIDSWELYDSVRGADKVLYPNGSNAEGTGSNFTSFDTDGFTVSGATSVNESGKNYLYMAFKINVS